MGKGRYGRRITIPAIYEYSNAASYPTTRYGNPKKFTAVKLKVSKEISGRPIVVLKKLIDLGFQQEYYTSDLIRSLIVFGFDKRYWTDTGILSTPFKYFLEDITRSKAKAERLKELEE